MHTQELNGILADEMVSLGKHGKQFLLLWTPVIIYKEAEYEYIGQVDYEMYVCQKVLMKCITGKIKYTSSERPLSENIKKIFRFSFILL